MLDAVFFNVLQVYAVSVVFRNSKLNLRHSNVKDLKDRVLETLKLKAKKIVNTLGS